MSWGHGDVRRDAAMHDLGAPRGGAPIAGASSACSLGKHLLELDTLGVMETVLSNKSPYNTRNHVRERRHLWPRPEQRLRQ